MNLKNLKITNKGLYWGLIVTFAILYLCVGFVSTLHSITFFHLANTVGLAVLLGLTYEVGQASVLFSILMTKNKDKFLPWLLMILLTSLQVTANVYSSFKYMAQSGSNDWVYWQKSILFGVAASSSDTYQMIISWIAGALLPVVALGMTALVAQNIKLMEEDKKEEPIEDYDAEMNEMDEMDKKTNRFEKIKENLNEFKDPEENELFGPVNLTDVEIEKISTGKYGPKFHETMEEIRKESNEIETIDASIGKKKGRPPKKVVESLPKEAVKIPKKRKINPLRKKAKISRIKNLREINQPSKGEEVIALLNDIEKNKVKESINSETKDVDVSPESSPAKPEIKNVPYISYINKDGVEVIDAKAIPNSPTEEVKKNQ